MLTFRKLWARREHGGMFINLQSCLLSTPSNETERSVTDECARWDLIPEVNQMVQILGIDCFWKA